MQIPLSSFLNFHTIPTIQVYTSFMEDTNIDHIHKLIRMQTPVSLMIPSPSLSPLIFFFFSFFVLLCLAILKSCVLWQQTDVYYSVLLVTQASRIHPISMPVDIGVYHATKPQDMVIEQWLNNGLYETQNVINLAENFKQLPADMTKESDENPSIPWWGSPRYMCLPIIVSDALSISLQGLIITCWRICFYQYLSIGWETCWYWSGI